MKMKRLVHTSSSSSRSAVPAHRSWRSSSAGTGQSPFSAPGAGWGRTGLAALGKCKGGPGTQDGAWSRAVTADGELRSCAAQGCRPALGPGLLKPHGGQWLCGGGSALCPLPTPPAWLCLLDLHFWCFPSDCWSPPGMAASPRPVPAQLCSCRWLPGTSVGLSSAATGHGSGCSGGWPGPALVPAVQPRLGGAGVPVRVGLCVERLRGASGLVLRSGPGFAAFRVAMVGAGVLGSVCMCACTRRTGVGSGGVSCACELSA